MAVITQDHGYTRFDERHEERACKGDLGVLEHQGLELIKGPGDKAPLRLA